jgi:hypothetical protein
MALAVGRYAHILFAHFSSQALGDCGYLPFGGTGSRSEPGDDADRLVPLAWRERHYLADCRGIIEAASTAINGASQDPSRVPSRVLARANGMKFEQSGQNLANIGPRPRYFCIEPLSVHGRSNAPNRTGGQTGQTGHLSYLSRPLDRTDRTKDA